MGNDQSPDTDEQHQAFCRQRRRRNINDVKCKVVFADQIRLNGLNAQDTCAGD
jgi:hypothetical protein